MKNTLQNSGRRSEILGLTACIAALPLLFGATGCATKQNTYTQNPSPAPEYTSMVGPAGPQGPVGPAGSQGRVGATGARGEGIAGATGEQGPVGPDGARGQTGARGPAGEVLVGRAGVAGPVGPAGERGETGYTGVQGASAIGSTGARGAVGPSGARGESGYTGAQGPTLVGPAGPAGRTGQAGVQGNIGNTGAQGSTTVGVKGATGRAGDAGAQGVVGSTGAQGPAGIVDRWTSYRDIWFDYNNAELQAADQGKIADAADYLQKNPSLKIGIDGSMDPRGTDPRDQELANLRVRTIRSALIAAGVPASRIQTGAFGNPSLARDRRVEVLLHTID